jgi:hypothetical protein
MRLDVLLQDLKRVHDEIRTRQKAQRRMSALVIATVGVGLPILLRIQGRVEAVLALLAGLSFVFLFIGYSYVGPMRGILRLSNYEINDLVPKINEEAGDDINDLMKWEGYVRDKIRGDFFQSDRLCINCSRRVFYNYNSFLVLLSSHISNLM